MLSYIASTLDYGPVNTNWSKLKRHFLKLFETLKWF